MNTMTNEQNRKDPKKTRRGIGGTGVDDTKGVSPEEPESRSSASPETSIQATGGTSGTSGTISAGPVGGFNAQRGSDLGTGADYGTGTDDLNAGNDFEFGSEAGARSDVGGPAGMESRVLNNTGVDQSETSRLGASVIPSGASEVHDGVGGRHGTRFDDPRDEKVQSHARDTEENGDLGDQIMSKIRDLGDAIERAGDRLKGEDHSRIGDAFRKISGNFGKTNHRALGGRMSNSGQYSDRI